MEFFKFLYYTIVFALNTAVLLLLVTSIYEHQKRAINRAIILLPITLSLAFIPSYLYGTMFFVVFDALFIIVAAYLFVPRFFFKKQTESIPADKIDERTIMFSRKELKTGTQRFDDYYAQHPEHKLSDDDFRQKPGLLSPNSTFYNPLAYNASDATFTIVDSLHQHVEGEPNATSLNYTPEGYAQFISSWAKKIGAKNIGFTPTKNYHWYSYGGRGERYGKEINTKHPIAIAFTVEMDHEMVKSAPQSSIIMESAGQYLQAGIIATQLAHFIRNCGYEARAHIDGNYQVVAPLIARDANLGEIGRMGLLMTKELGPRVRIGVVTTNMPLPIAERQYDDSVDDFCDKCLKCAINCPANAIPDIKKQSINNVERWQINSEKCFNYWCIAGTDCGRCMSTCPYSHPNNFLHNMVRWCIRNFPNFRYWAVKMDDFFYGRKNSPAQLPSWLRYSAKK